MHDHLPRDRSMQSAGNQLTPKTKHHRSRKDCPRENACEEIFSSQNHHPSDEDERLGARIFPRCTPPSLASWSPFTPEMRYNMDHVLFSLRVGGWVIWTTADELRTKCTKAHCRDLSIHSPMLYTVSGADLHVTPHLISSVTRDWRSTQGWCWNMTRMTRT